jgi:hypothetical protein
VSCGDNVASMVCGVRNLLSTQDFGLDADGASVARHVSRCDPRVLIAEAGEYYELRGGGS